LSVNELIFLYRTSGTSDSKGVKMRAYLIVEGKDAKTAQWFYADYSWQALDEAKSYGFDEIVGFCVVKTMEVDQVSFECME